MHEAKGWRLSLNCPVCRRATYVNSAEMRTVMRCPHCRSTVVIESSGLRRLEKPKRKRPKRSQQSKRSAKPEKKPRPRNTSRIVMAIVAVFVITFPIVFAFSRSEHFDKPSSPQSAVRDFQNAWIEGDHEAARSLVHSEDLPRYEAWSLPRRAALESGFGSAFTGRVTEIQVVQPGTVTAQVRVRFEVRGRPQQQFQDWAQENGQWRLRLP